MIERAFSSSRSALNTDNAAFPFIAKQFATRLVGSRRFLFQMKTLVETLAFYIWLLPEQVRVAVRRCWQFVDTCWRDPGTCS